MYFKHITLENVGPIENLDFEFPINEEGTPKPVFLWVKMAQERALCCRI